MYKFTENYEISSSPPSLFTCNIPRYIPHSIKIEMRQSDWVLEPDNSESFEFPALRPDNLRDTSFGKLLM